MKRGSAAANWCVLATRWLAAALMLGLVWTAPARASIGLRAGVHEGFGRLVVSPSKQTPYSLTREADTLTLRMAGGFERRRVLPPNVLRVAADGDTLTLTLAAGASVRAWRQDARLILDIYASGKAPPKGGKDATLLPYVAPRAEAPAAAAAPPARPGSPVSAATLPTPDAAHAATPGAALGAGSGAAPGPGTAAPASAGANTSASAGTTPKEAAAGAAAGVALLPFDAQTGAAAFRRGDTAVLVFDAPKTPDLSALRADPILAQAVLAPLPDATRLLIRLPPDRALGMEHRPLGWEIRVLKVPVPGGKPARIGQDGGRVTLGVEAPGRALVLDDPDTGGRLLVGTVRAAGAVGGAYRSAEFSLLPTWLGVAVVPASDRLALRPGTPGFTLAAETGPALASALGAAAGDMLSGAAGLTREFDFAAEPVPDLLARLRNERLAEALAPPLARFEPRLRTARTLLGLGLAREAAALVHAAASDDPGQAAKPETRQLSAMAAFLADAPDLALGPPDAPMSDETALWQALASPAAPGSAAAIAATWRVALGYPAPLRDRLMPRIADALLAAGNGAELAAVLAHAAPGTLPLVRARALRQAGHAADALAAFDAIAAGADRRDAALAAREAVELRLAGGVLDAKAAAAALDRHLYDWRGGAPELELRLRVAALRTRAGELRAALALLRETAGLFPDAQDRVREAERDVVRALLLPGGAAELPPLDVVAIAEESADLLNETESGATLAPALVDKLLALDLPDRAAPILEKLVASARTPALRAALGERLATLRLDRSDAAGAREALRETAADGLDPALQDERRVAAARADSALGDRNAALADLSGAMSEAALDLRARLCGAGQDWAGAATALQALAQRRLPPGSAMLDAPQRELVLRLAGALSSAGNIAALRALQAEQAPRFPAGRDADLLRLLAASPVRQVGDLPRAAAELAAAQAALPGASAP